MPISRNAYRCPNMASDGEHAKHNYMLRWYGIDRENRQCLKCNSRSIGDEFHYIMECHFFTENRSQLISRYLTQRPNILKFKQIMCTSEKIKLEKLCRLIRKINRSDILLANT